MAWNFQSLYKYLETHVKAWPSFSNHMLLDIPSVLARPLIENVAVFIESF
jgi:hypothetical protein